VLYLLVGVSFSDDECLREIVLADVACVLKPAFKSGILDASEIVNFHNTDEP